jgi:transcriptional regulator with XRE-family HTH domain
MIELLTESEPMPGKPLPPIARLLKGLREKADISQQELAFRSGLSVSVISQIEQGKKEDPRLSTIVALADALGVDVGKLVPRRGKK